MAAGLAALPYAADLAPPSSVVFWAFPAAGVLILVRLPRLWRIGVTTGIAIGAALIVAGLFALPRPDDARAGTDLSAFTEEERVYAEQAFAADNYGCNTEFKTYAPGPRGWPRDYLSRISDMEDLGAEGYLMRVQISNWLRLPSYTASIYLSEETSVIVRPDYITVCLTEGPERRAEVRGDDGLLYPAPWRWQRSADGGASWADVPRRPHREWEWTAGYTFRYVPSPADLADENNVRLRACVDVRGEGEVCTASASPRL